MIRRHRPSTFPSPSQLPELIRAHPDMLARQKLPDKLVTKNIWKERFNDIRAFEHHLARNGVAVLKLFLHISKEEQRRRLLTRLDEPAKRWKFSLGDIAERKLWDKYMAAYGHDPRHQSARSAVMAVGIYEG